MDINHNLLKALGVSHESLDSVCQLSRKHGLYSKLTGAGGGGSVIALLRHGMFLYQMMIFMTRYLEAARAISAF